MSNHLNQERDHFMTNITRTIVVAVSALLISSAAMAQDITTKNTSVLDAAHGKTISQMRR